MERATPEATIEFVLCLTRFGHCAIREQRRVRSQRSVMLRDARQDRFAERRRLQLSTPEPP
jgi:hypothetical protein